MVKKGFENSESRSAEELAGFCRQSATAEALLQKIDKSNATYKKKYQVGDIETLRSSFLA
jgi:hypothetical protein